MTARQKILALVGLALTLGLGSLPYPVWDDEFADTAHLVFNEVIYWTLVVATLVYVIVVERRPLASIGLRRPRALDPRNGHHRSRQDEGGCRVRHQLFGPARPDD